MRRDRLSNRFARERQTREAIRASGDVRADTAFRDRLKREFVAGTISEPVVPREEPRARSMPRWWWVLVPAAAAVLLVALFLPRTVPKWTLETVHGKGQIEIEGQTLAADQNPLVAGALSAGGRLRMLEGVSINVRLDERLLLELDEGADVTLPVLTEGDSGGLLVSEVHRGELRIMTGPGFPGTTLHVLTTEGRTEIVGTVISVYKGDGYTCVCVLEGTARIGEDEAQLEVVGEDMLKIMFEDGAAPIVTDIEPNHKADLVEFSERYRDLFAPGN